MKKLLLFSFIGFSYISFAQGYLPQGTRAAGMANASVLNTDNWAYFHNPAASADFKEISIGLTYENRYLLKEFQSQAFVANLPLRKGVLSLGTHHTGFKDFRSIRTGLGYAMQLSPIFSLGVQLNYQMLRLPSYYGTKSTATAEVGLLAKINEKWAVGMSVFNLGRAKLSDFQDDRFETIIRIGTNYKLSEVILFAAEVEKGIESQPVFKIGMDYSLAKKFFLRAGINSNPTRFAFGFGYKQNKVSIDLAMQYHTILGFIPSFGLNINFLKQDLKPVTNETSPK